MRTTVLPIYIDLFKSDSRIRIEGDSLREFSLMNIDPVFSSLSEHRDSSNKALLDLVFSLGKTDEGGFQGRRK